jgi:hypothetical protein
MTAALLDAQSVVLITSARGFSSTRVKPHFSGIWLEQVRSCWWMRDDEGVARRRCADGGFRRRSKALTRRRKLLCSWSTLMLRGRELMSETVQSSHTPSLIIWPSAFNWRYSGVPGKAVMNVTPHTRPFAVNRPDPTTDHSQFCVARQMPWKGVVAEMRTHCGISKSGGGCRLGLTGWQKERTRQSPPQVTAETLSESSLGRVLLHVVCLCRDHHLRWHWNGIQREVHAVLHHSVNR